MNTTQKFIRTAGTKRDRAVMEKKVAVNRMEVNSSSVPLCNVQSPPQSTPPDHSALERLIGMLEKVLMNNAQSRPASRKTSGLPHVKGLNDTPCLVCKDSAHSTLSHCKDNLCFVFIVFFTGLRKEQRITRWPGIKLTDLRAGEDHADLESVPPTSHPSFEAFSDYESLSQLYSSDISSEKIVIFLNLQTVPRSDSLFYTSVSIVNGLSFKALIDSGSMACTLSEPAEAMLLQCIPGISKQSAHDIMIVGCGGHRVTPTAIYDLQVTVYGCSMTVPTLVVPGQSEEMILGTNVIKRLLTRLRETSGDWKLMSMPSYNQSDACCQFMSLFSNTERWRGESVPDRVGTVKPMRSVTLELQTEHLVWGKLPVFSVLSVGSTVIIELTVKIKTKTDNGWQSDYTTLGRWLHPIESHKPNQSQNRAEEKC